MNWPKWSAVARSNMSQDNPGRRDPGEAAALDGLRILDLTQVAAGPYATMLLALMGAEVIKLEACSRMDINRGNANPLPGDPRVYPNGDPGQQPWNRTAHHVHRNINKFSVTLDLATAQGKDLFLSLARVSDVLVENYRASVMDRLGLGYNVVAQVNPQLVYVKISSQGATGPEKDYGSLGSTLEQTAGLASITGYEDQRPLLSNETFPDPVVGILAVGAVMAGLRRRNQQGRGCFVDLSQREATIGLMGEHYLDYSANGVVAQPMGNRHRDMAPQGVYPCDGEDMWVAISAGSDPEWHGLCRALELPELAQDPRFVSREARRRNQDDLDKVITGWTRQRDHYQAMHLLQGQGVPAGAVAKGSETILDRHLEARGFWDEVDHPEAGVYKQTTTPWILSKSPRQRATAARDLGEDNGHILGELLGLSQQEFDELQTAGVIGTRPTGAG